MATGSSHPLAGGPGFEPRLTGSEPIVLPLNYPPRARIVARHLASWSLICKRPRKTPYEDCQIAEPSLWERFCCWPGRRQLALLLELWRRDPGLVGGTEVVFLPTAADNLRIEFRQTVVEVAAA